MNNQSSKKKGIIIAGVSAIVLIAILGISFAIWNYSRTTDNQILVAGDIYMKFTETNQLTIPSALPSEGPGEDDYFEFTIEGKNTYSKPIWYEIDIQHGEPHQTRQTRIEDNLLAFKLVEVKDEDQEEVLIEKGSYTGLAAGKGIYVNTIPAGTNTKITRTYRLYMWISSKTIIGNTIDANYDMDEWNDVYASIKVNVTGDFNEKEIKKEIQYGIGTEALKSIAVSNIEDTCTEPDYTGELVAINTKGKLYQEGNNETIREYRYVGPEVNNYIYFNCQDGKEQNEDNCEIWRILGIFKDEAGAEHIKIVRNNILTGDMMPLTYTAINEKEYKIRYSSSPEKAYWNYPTSGTRNNDWATGGLQYWLNAGSDKETSQPSDGYMSYLSRNAKSMIENTKYYLGTAMTSSTKCNDASSSSTSYSGTVIDVYKNERTTNEIYTQDEIALSCLNYDTFPSTFERKGGKIWPDNSATWPGYISLMYPSDYGYTANSCNWTKTIVSNTSSTSWIYKTANHSGDEWLLSPSSHDSGNVAYWGNDGRVYDDKVYYVSRGVRPSLNLISGATIVDGDGTVDEPYQLNSGQ